MMYVISPEDVASVFSTPFFVSYWPLVLGTIVICVAMVTGYGRAILPLAALMAAVQAWHSGLFS
jgi:hypothetical protein